MWITYNKDTSHIVRLIHYGVSFENNQFPPITLHDAYMHPLELRIPAFGFPVQAHNNPLINDFDMKNAGKLLSVI